MVKERPRHRRLWLAAAVLLVLLALAGWGGLTAYRQSRLASFAPACRVAMERGEWSQLERLASRWADWEPDRAEPWIFWAEARQQQEDYDGAARLLENLPDDDPLTIPALLERTTLLFGTLNRPREGVATCRRLLSLNPALCEARQRMIFFYSQTLQRRRMVEEIHEALRHDCDRPENYVYLLGTDWLTFSNGYELNNRWLTAEPDNETYLAARAIHFVNSAGLTESAGTGEAAGTGAAEDPQARPAGDSLPPGAVDHAQVMRDYLQRFPRNLELLTYFLNQATLAGDLPRVAELLRQAPEEALEDNRFWRYKAWLHARQDQWQEAEQAYQQALELNPYDWVSQHQLADVMRRFQKFEDVQRLERLSQTGKQLRDDLLALPNARAVPGPLLERMANYMEDCGQRDAAAHLRRRIDGLRLLETGPS